MSERQTLVIPADMRSQINLDMRGDSLAMLDDNARFVVRRMVAAAYKRGFDDGWFAGQDDYRTDRDVRREQAEASDG